MPTPDPRGGATSGPCPSPGVPDRRVLTSAHGVRLNKASEGALRETVDARAELLVATAKVVPDDGGVVLRADGGLWVAAGHDGYWTVVGVPPGAWAPRGSVSGVIPQVVVRRDLAPPLPVPSARPGRR